MRKQAFILVFYFCTAAQEVYSMSNFVITGIFFKMKITIMGLDPGTLNMGYGILLAHPHSIERIDSGVLSSSNNSIGERISELYNHLKKIFQKHKPDHCAIEKVFLGKNPKSTFALGQAFSISLLNAHQNSCKVFEYETKVIKKSVTGSGSASKESVAFMVKNILNMKQDITPMDQSDALATALCHAYICQTRFLQPSISPSTG